MFFSSDKWNRPYLLFLAENLVSLLDELLVGLVDELLHPVVELESFHDAVVTVRVDAHREAAHKAFLDAVRAVGHYSH